MFEELKIGMKEAVSQAISEQSKCTCTKKKIQEAFDEKADEIYRKQLNISYQMVSIEAKQRMMIDAMAHSSDLMKETQEKMEIQENNTAKRMFVLSGLETERKRNKARQQINHFIVDCLNLTVGIEDFYYIGGKKPRDIVVVLATNNERHAVLTHGHMLKGLINEDGKEYRVPPMTKLQSKFSIQRSRRDPGNSEQKGPSGSRGGESERKEHHCRSSTNTNQKISPPDPTHVLRLPMSKLDAIMAIQIQTGEPVKAEGNKFLAYSICTADFQTLQDVYMQIRLNHAEARHIVAAWNIPGTNEYETADGCDDDDHGVAREIVQLMLANDITTGYLCSEEL